MSAIGFSNYAVIMLVWFAFFSCYGKRQHSEVAYQHAWSEKQNGTEEVVNDDRTRVDCVTETHAVEFDFAKKWAESVGQALHYQLMTGKRGKVVLILEDPEKEKVYFERVQKLAKKYDFDVEYVTNEVLDIKNGKCQYQDCVCNKKSNSTIIAAETEANLPSLNINNEEDRRLMKKIIIEKVNEVFGEKTNWSSPVQRIESVDVYDMVINIGININENLTNRMMISGVILRSWKLMKSIFTDSRLKSVPKVVLFGKVPFVNQFGKTEISKAISLTMDREMADKIVWNKVADPRAIFDEVEKVWVRYSLRN